MTELHPSILAVVVNLLKPHYYMYCWKTAVDEWIAFHVIFLQCIVLLDINIVDKFISTCTSTWKPIMLYFVEHPLIWGTCNDSYPVQVLHQKFTSTAQDFVCCSPEICYFSGTICGNNSVETYGFIFFLDVIAYFM